MNARLNLIKLKTTIAYRNVWQILKNWRNSFGATLIAFAFFELTYWLFNLSVLTTILTSGNVSLLEKIDVLLSPFRAIAATDGYLQVWLMVILSLLQGVNIVLLIYVVRHQKKVDSRLVGGGSLAGLLAVIGLGCPACGTSLLTPLLAVFVSGASVGLEETITNVALPLAIVISVYGMYVLGARIAAIKAENHLYINVNGLQ